MLFVSTDVDYCWFNTSRQAIRSEAFSEHCQLYSQTQISSNMAYMSGGDTLELVDGVVELGLHGCGPRDARRRSENVRG